MSSLVAAVAVQMWLSIPITRPIRRFIDLWDAIVAWLAEVTSYHHQNLGWWTGTIAAMGWNGGPEMVFSLRIPFIALDLLLVTIQLIQHSLITKCHTRLPSCLAPPQ